MRNDGPSRTAVLVCQGRAAADGRLAVARFHDPIAAQLLTADEMVPVDRARRGEQPTDWRARLDVEQVAACAELMAVRTVAIDDAVVGRPNPQVVIVGAGLDGRPWRWSPEIAPTLFAVDHPATQDDVVLRANDLHPSVGRLVLVPVDLARWSLDAALSAAGHDPERPTTWVWEGVVPYLTRADVRATTSTTASRSAPGSRLVVNYQAPSWRGTLGRRAVRVASRLLRRDHAMSDEPWRSLWTPDAMAEMLDAHGWHVTRDDDLARLAGDVGVTPSHAISLGSGRLAVADR